MPTTRVVKGKRKKKGEQDRKKIATGFFRLLMQGKVKDGLRFFAPDCEQHNPYISGSMDALTDAMISAGEKMTDEVSGRRIHRRARPGRWGPGRRPYPDSEPEPKAARDETGPPFSLQGR